MIPISFLYANMLDLTEMGRFFDKPGWCRDSYWSFPVLDPAGLTSAINGRSRNN